MYFIDGQDIEWMVGWCAYGVLGSLKVTAAFVKGDGCWSLKADAYNAMQEGGY